MNEDNTEKKLKKEQNPKKSTENEISLLGFRGYTEDIFSTIKNTGLSISVPEVWNKDISNLIENKTNSSVRHIGKTIKLMKEKQAINIQNIHQKMSHPLLRNPFTYIFIIYMTFLIFSIIMFFL
ncbi:MAG: hypothetical protein ACTSVY_08040 [Candidatus Helarchaeota archaeon]